MPTLPTLTVTDAQATRMLDAFGSPALYKAWLARSIKEFVVAKEAERIFQEEYARAQQVEIDKQATLDALAASLEVTAP